jgi:23S rRNA-intervening sequence protein
MLQLVGPEKDIITRSGDLMQAQGPRSKTFRDLLVWQKAHEFVLEVYRYTKSFPRARSMAWSRRSRKRMETIDEDSRTGVRMEGATLFRRTERSLCPK